MKYILFIIIICFVSSQISEAQWVQVPNGMGNLYIHKITANSTTIFAGTLNNGILRSTNNGDNWIQTSINNISAPALAVNSDTIYVGLNGGDLYKSTNNGVSWNSIYLFSQTALYLLVNGNNIFAGTYFNGIYKSTDKGLSWTQTPLNNRTVYAIAVSGNNIFAGTQDYGVYKSTDEGTSWVQTSLNNVFVHPLLVNGNNIFAGGITTNYGVYRSTDNGTTWTSPYINTRQVFALARYGNNIFAGTYQFGVYVSTDNGIGWVQRYEGLPNNVWISSLCILNNYIFAGTYTPGNGVWRRPLGELTGIQPVSNEVPNKFSLSQNYPNPFNPVCRIKFDIPKTGDLKTDNVKLLIYDLLGREVAVLVNGFLVPGIYEVEWNARNYPSGIYIYRIESKLFAETKKMILIK